MKQTFSLAVSLAFAAFVWTASGATYQDFAAAAKSLDESFRVSGAVPAGSSIYVAPLANETGLRPAEGRIEGMVRQQLSGPGGAGFVVADSAAGADYVWRSTLAGNPGSVPELRVEVTGPGGARAWYSFAPVGTKSLAAAEPFGTSAPASSTPPVAISSSSGRARQQPAGTTGFPGAAGQYGYGMAPAGLTGGAPVVFSSLFSLMSGTSEGRTQDRGFLGRYLLDSSWRYRKNDDAKSSQNFDFGGRAPVSGNLDLALRGFLDWDDHDENNALHSTSGKDLTAYGLDALLQYSFGRSQTWNPYLGVGFQWIHADFGPSAMLGADPRLMDAWREAVRMYNQMAAEAGSNQRIKDGGDSICPIANAGLEINVTPTLSFRGDFQFIIPGIGHQNDFADDPRELLTGRVDWLLGGNFGVAATAGYEFEDGTLSATAGIQWLF